MPPEYVDTRRPAASVSWKRASRSAAIWPASFRCRNRAMSTRFSRPVRISSTAANCPVRLMDSRTFAGCAATSKPSTVAVPASSLSSVDRIFTTVVLPAPLEPSRAKMLPRATSKSTPRSARNFWYDFSRPCTWIAWTGCAVTGCAVIGMPFISVAVIALVTLLLLPSPRPGGRDHVQGARSGIHRGFTAVS